MIEVCIYSKDGMVTEYYAGDCAKRIIMERMGQPRVRISKMEYDEQGEELYPNIEVGKCVRIGMRIPVF